MAKRFILNADDFGMSRAYNRAVLDGFEHGLLKSASLVANGKSYDEAVDIVLPYCEGLGVGIHLNIIEGRSLCTDLTQLTDANGMFNNSYLQLILKAYGKSKKEFLEQVEREFRVQIEKVMAKTKITHIDSHVHTHAIPPIFELVCKLAKEYGINQVRTQYEKTYFIPDYGKILSIKYPVNLVKVALLNYFTSKNKKKIIKYNLKTNDYLLGVTYTSMMDALSVAYGLSAINNKNNITVEALIHPCRYDDGIIDNHFVEYKITKNKKLKSKIELLGYEITNYAEEV